MVTVLPPYVEINGHVYAVVGWEPDLPLPDRIELRRLSASDAARYRRLASESAVELWANVGGGR